MQDKRVFVFPLIFAIVLVPVMIAALLIFRPGESQADCDCSAAQPSYASHAHGLALARENRAGMQLLFNVTPAAALYGVVDGRLQQVGEIDDSMKHVTVDVLDAELALGERLPVTVHLVVRNAETGEVVIDDMAPAMYAPGHGYHFGDNYALAPDTRYAWHVTISPAQALRVEGTHDRWLEPVEWEGSFRLDAEGNVESTTMRMQTLGEFTRQGVHVVLHTHHAETLYEVRDGAAHPVEELSAHGHGDSVRYFAVDVTDHAVNFEEKLLGADVTLRFEPAGSGGHGDHEAFEVALQPVLSPVMGYHYGANVALEPGDWSITVTVSGLNFQRHAGAAVSLPLGAVSGTFSYTLEDQGV